MVVAIIASQQFNPRRAVAKVEAFDEFHFLEQSHAR